MEKKKEKIKSKVTVKDIMLTIRKSWGDFNSCDRVVEDKTKYKRCRDKKINQNDFD